MCSTAWESAPDRCLNPAHPVSPGRRSPIQASAPRPVTPRSARLARPGVLPGILGSWGLLVLVVLVVVEFSGGGITITGVRADGQFGTQPVKVCAVRALVLELTGHLYLLGLGSAAPHWLDPLERPEPGQGPMISASLVSVRCKTAPPPRNGKRDVHQHPYRYNRTRFAPLMPTLIPSCPGRFRAGGRHRTSAARPDGPRPPMGAPRRRPRWRGSSRW